MIRKAEPADVNAVAELACLLWDSHSPEEMRGEFADFLTDGEAAVMIAEEDGRAVGFAQCQLRHDYVEGCETSPVGYLEGVFVCEEYRRRGIATELVRAGEAWARGLGCSEFASDCELDNVDSLRFHLGIGFIEMGRNIHFSKQI